MSGVREDGRRLKRVKEERKFIRKHISLTANTAHPYRISTLLVHQVTKCLQNHYRPKPFPCLGAAALFGGDGDDYDTLYYCTWQSQSTQTLTQTGLFLLNLSNVKLATIRQKVTWNNIHSALIKTKPKTKMTVMKWNVLKQIKRVKTHRLTCYFPSFSFCDTRPFGHVLSAGRPRRASCLACTCSRVPGGGDGEPVIDACPWRSRSARASCKARQQRVRQLRERERERASDRTGTTRRE